MALKEKMQQLRESVPQAGKEATRDAPSTYRINAINPAQNIEDQWAYIDTPYNYGSRGPHQGVRKIRVGDELPQGSVVSITAEGIQVLPDFEGSEEYVIPMGSSSYEPPPGEKTEPEAPTVKELIEEEKGRRDYESTSDHFLDLISSGQELVDENERTYDEHLDHAFGEIEGLYGPDALADAGDDEGLTSSYDPEMIGLGADTISPFSNFNRAAKRQRIGEAIEGMQSGSDLRTIESIGPAKRYSFEEIDFDLPEPIESIEI